MALSLVSEYHVMKFQEEVHVAEDLENFHFLIIYLQEEVEVELNFHLEAEEVVEELNFQ